MRVLMAGVGRWQSAVFPMCVPDVASSSVNGKRVKGKEGAKGRACQCGGRRRVRRALVKG
jgi:hypothetical protein